jgi:quercetin dioxygenase-like cupin family protein
MRIAPLSISVCALLMCGSGTVPPAPRSQAANTTKATPLILQKDEGERRIVRGWPGHPDPGETFILKVDPKNGSSSHLVLMTADIRQGGAIHPHRHPDADEILFVESGTARVHLGDTTSVVHGGATVFISANTWISVDNIGSGPISAVAIFSAPGFEEFMRETSVREGEKNVPMTEAENDAAEKKHAHDVVYKEP